MTKEEVFKKLAELNRLKEKLDRELKEVYQQIIEVKQSIDKHLAGLCFRDDTFYYKIIVDTGCHISYIVCSSPERRPKDSQIYIVSDYDKMLFLLQEREVITIEEFNKTLEDNYLKIKEW